MKRCRFAVTLLWFAVAATPASAQAVDALGDPLPDGALYRLGSVRLRHYRGAPRHFLDDGKKLVSTGRAEMLIWDTGASVVVSRDKGKTWQTTGKPVPDVLFTCGPCFGKNEKHLVVATLKDVRESTDAGVTWKIVAPYPADLPPQADIKYGVGFPSIGYDPARDIFYLYFANPKKFTEGRLLKYTRT